MFNGGVIPSSYSAEYREYIEKMQGAFGTIGEKINEENLTLDGESLDDIRIKAVFFTIFAYGENGAKSAPPISSGNYSLYFGTDFSILDDNFYINFGVAFTESIAENGVENVVTIKELDKIYTNLSSVIGKVITDDEKANIHDLYMQIKYGYIVNGANNGIPGEAFDDDTFVALMNEATKCIGYPYVWGGSTPSESFDCSGFICWSYTQSGVYNLPRTTAQGIYNQCTLVSKGEVKPGDLVFFTKTYDCVNPVTHVAIYVGNNQFLH